MRMRIREEYPEELVARVTAASLGRALDQKFADGAEAALQLERHAEVSGATAGSGKEPQVSRHCKCRRMRRSSDKPRSIDPSWLRPITPSGAGQSGRVRPLDPISQDTLRSSEVRPGWTNSRRSLWYGDSIGLTTKNGQDGSP